MIIEDKLTQEDYPESHDACSMNSLRGITGN